MEQTIQYKTQARLKRAFYFKFSKRKRKTQKYSIYYFYSNFNSAQTQTIRLFEIQSKLSSPWDKFSNESIVNYSYDLPILLHQKSISTFQ